MRVTLKATSLCSAAPQAKADPHKPPSLGSGGAQVDAPPTPPCPRDHRPGRFFPLQELSALGNALSSTCIARRGGISASSSRWTSASPLRPATSHRLLVFRCKCSFNEIRENSRRFASFLNSLAQLPVPSTLCPAHGGWQAEDPQKDLGCGQRWTSPGDPWQGLLGAATCFCAVSQA